MARGKKQIDGQLSFDFCLDARNYVCQANTLIGGKQALKINSAKLIRAAIMQVVKDDTELKPYVVTIMELADLFGVPKNNIYRDIESITDDIIRNPVFVKQEQDGQIRWIKIPWVTRCEYNSDVGISLQLNHELKPFLLNLKEHYTQYTLDTILNMKSVYSIRIYELLQSKVMTTMVPKRGVDMEISLEELKEVCGCEEKYDNSFSNFRMKVLDKAVKEINEKSIYRVKYDYVKKGRAICGIKFHMNLFYHKEKQ